MSGFKSVVKEGWHPKGKDGGKESWRGDFKGINQVAGWMGKSKSSDVEAASSHVSRPLATLKDPSSFGPPPKNVNYHGGAALPNEITPHRGGLGAPLTQAEIADARTSTSSPRLQEEEANARPPPPALPYRADRTGLRTDNLPPPPVHRDLQQGSSPTTSQPRLPPRLPARQNTAPTSPLASDVPPPSYDAVAKQPTASSYISQKSASNLSRAGVSVPGFGIGNSESNPWKDHQSQSQTTGSNQLSELQSRFARMKSPPQEASTVDASASQPQAQSQAMPSWKQSQSAFTTAQNLRTNPESVSLADAQSAAQTAGQAQRSASAFKEKHADSIAKGQAKAKAFDQKYKFTSKINKFLDENSDESNNTATQTQPHQAYSSPPPQLPQHPSALQQQQPLQSPPVDPPTPAASFSRKPPPPPAPRKPANLQAPPPVPTGTKPTFG